MKACLIKLKSNNATTVGFCSIIQQEINHLNLKVFINVYDKKQKTNKYGTCVYEFMFCFEIMCQNMKIGNKHEIMFQIKVLEHIFLEIILHVFFWKSTSTKSVKLPPG